MFDVLVGPFRNDGRGSGRRNGVRRLVMVAMLLEMKSFASMRSMSERFAS